jgi:uncharacterized protein (TIGR02996 family)
VDSDDDLIAAIAADPVDRSLQEVWADWLMERGDPRGEELRAHGIVTSLRVDTFDNFEPIIARTPLVLARLDFTAYPFIDGDDSTNQRYDALLARLDTRWLELAAFVVVNSGPGGMMWSSDRLLDVLDEHASKLPRLREVWITVRPPSDEGWRKFLAGPLGSRMTEVIARGHARVPRRP